MKVLSLWQPWADLVVAGVKRVETRSWGTKHRGLLLIHATMGMPPAAKAALEEPLIKDAVRRVHGDRIIAPILFDKGVVIGAVNVERCVEITQALADELRRKNPTEHALGDYTPGRVAWVFSEPRAFASPVRWSGRQRLWNFPPEEEWRIGMLLQRVKTPSDLIREAAA